MAVVLRTNQFFNAQFFTLASFFVIIWIMGAIGYQSSWCGSPTNFIGDWEAFYRSLQLFGLNHNGSGLKENYTLPLQAARFAAPLFIAVSILAALTDRGLTLLQIAEHFRPVGLGPVKRAAILGFGPVGQAVARKLVADTSEHWRVAAAAASLKNVAFQAAGSENLLLFEADTASDEAFRNLRASDADLVIVALDDDMANLEAAERVKAWMLANFSAPNAAGAELFTSKIRVLTSDPEVADDLPEAVATGFMCGNGISFFSLKEEAARELVGRARFDRAALLTGQSAVHVVVAGCGGQGEAVFYEVLKQCWRVGLDAPVLTVLDRHADAIEARIRRRSPALFDTGLAVPNWVPPAFFNCDIDTLDTERLPQALGSRLHAHRATGWVFACADDAVNLRAGLALQTQMMRRQISVAPIYIRNWGAHRQEAHEIEMRAISLTHTFGSLRAALETTSALKRDPDEGPRQMHTAYKRAGEAMAKQIKNAYSGSTLPPNSKLFTFSSPDWNSLSESLRSSNRRAFQHAVHKLEDFGYSWRSTKGRQLPCVGPDAATRVEALSLDLYKANYDVAQVAAPDQADAQTVASISTCEHSRWVVDRAIDGWKGGSPRSNVQRVHPSMRQLQHIDRETRHYDNVIFITTLQQCALQNATHANLAFKKCELVFYLDLNAPVRVAGVSEDKWSQVTDFVFVMPPVDCQATVDGWYASLNKQLPEGETVDAPNFAAAAHRDAAIDELLAKLSAVFGSGKLARVCVAFRRPPDPGTISFAENLTSAARASGANIDSYWDWDARSEAPGQFSGLGQRVCRDLSDKPFFPMPRLPE